MPSFRPDPFYEALAAATLPSIERIANQIAAHRYDMSFLAASAACRTTESGEATTADVPAD